MQNEFMLSDTKKPCLNVNALPPEIKATVEAAIAGTAVKVIRDDHDIGTLSFQSAVIEGEVIPTSKLPPPEAEIPDGAVVVATAMHLPSRVRQRLSEEFGTGYLVLDLNEAPRSTDIVLVNPVSSQLLAHLRERFPTARIIITEIEDEEHGIDYSGPVSRALGAGASAYLPPRPIEHVAEAVIAYIETAENPALNAPTQPRNNISGNGTLHLQTGRIQQ